MVSGGPYTIAQQFSDRRDFTLLGSTPTLMQPRFGRIAPLEKGHRYIVGKGGLYVEAKTKVLHVIARVAASAIALPYGDVKPLLALPENGLPDPIMQDLVARSKAAAPNEWGGLVLYDAQTGYRIVEPPALSRSADRVSYSWSDIDEETVAFDVHSHGFSDAFFSAQDDEDDSTLGGVYLALVIGCLGNARPSVAARMVVHGHFIEVHAGK